MLRKLVVGGSALVAAAVVVLTVQVASAHSRPIRFDPPPGTVLNSAPTKIDGWFTADLRRDPAWNYIHVSDTQGNRVDAGEPVLSADRRQMTVSLRPDLPNGRYVVNWRTFDDGDGAIFGDCYTFFVGQQAADAAFTDKARLDGGGTCQRIDVSARNGTPVAAGTPTAAGTPVAGGTTVTAGHDEDDDEMAGASPDSDSDGIPVWGLVAGVVVGVVAGGIGGRFLGSKA